MTRALATFIVAHQGVSIRVRLLPSCEDVDREYRAGKRRRYRGRAHGFFQASRSARALHVGTIALAGNSRLDELVPHEVVHAVMHKLGRVDRYNDEPLASIVGALTRLIHRRIARVGIEVGGVRL